jgi:uncharacterized protein
VVYEWDAAKARTNLAKHGVSFDDAATVFLDPLAVTFPDPNIVPNEEREITIGHTADGRIIFVAHCRRGERIRMFSARRVTRTERNQYEEGIN